MATLQIGSEDGLKRQQRRRLVGAVALFTALIIIVPMVLDREPKPSGTDIELRIPDKDKAGEFTSQMVLPESAALATSEPVGASAPAVAAVPMVEPAPRPETKPAPAKPEKHAKPEQKSAKTTQPKEGYAVQVGAFANVSAAMELRDKLRKQGLPVYTERAGETVRVRIGAYPTREAAEKVLHKLEAQGLHPAVVSAP